MKHIPNFITSLNLAAGFFAVIFAANDDLMVSSWFILAAMVFDFLDGFSARMLKAYSLIGKELDSLADVVSFGVAPAMIIFKLITISPSPATNLSGDSWLSSATLLPGLIAGLMPVCAALRLAKFNIDATQTKSFKGLPTPANALAVISVVIAANYSEIAVLKSIIESHVILSVYAIILSLMMVSRMPLLSLKMTNLRLKGNEGRYILVGMVLIFLVTSGIASAPLIIPFYLIASLISRFFETEGIE